MNDTNPSVADVIWSQISLNTKMACGARSPMADGNTLSFVILSGKSSMITVTLEPSDTYTVRRTKTNLRTLAYSVLGEVTDVYAEDLSEVVYGMVNK